MQAAAGSFAVPGFAEEQSRKILCDSRIALLELKFAGEDGLARGGGGIFALHTLSPMNC